MNGTREEIKDSLHPSFGKNGMISTPHPLATKAGLDVLKAGGNAVDAAIAANAMLAVVMPDQCGLGGDLFALVYSPKEKTIMGLNGSGAAPSLAFPGAFEKLGIKSMPQLGCHSITVPGMVDAWGEMAARYGSLPLSKLLESAIQVAENGFLITPPLAKSIEAFLDLIQAGEMSSQIFLEGNQPLKAGQKLVQEKVAGVLKTIASEGYRSYYEGKIGEAIARTIKDKGGFLCQEDLINHRSEWVNPIYTSYRDRLVYSFPPNSSGLIFLALVDQLNKISLKEIDFQSKNFISSCIQLVCKVVGQVQNFITDPRFSGDDWKSVLKSTDLKNSTVEITPKLNLNGDTIALCVADNEGMGITLIQSIYHDFGSGVFIDEGGFFMQNRGASFSLNPTRPDCIAPGKRPPHTLTPAMMVGPKGLEMLFGTRGGAGQPQTLLQILSSVVDYGLDIQTALTGPRWIYGSTTSARRINGLVMEQRFPKEISSALMTEGIPVTVTEDFSPGWMGCAQGIIFDHMNGGFYGGADPRGGGLASGF